MSTLSLEIPEEILISLKAQLHQQGMWLTDIIINDVLTLAGEDKSV
ncbi:hypothetical protein [Nodularia sphaerocarpa]|nr:hypothetical protein [Nodularia sphaerocarpa]MDB9373899.1 hypothetical protein [Nodularia sphaerocarpa CS-585]MDB9376847.1 hypothetical protein [Nodularia sphaerocarpa CS-585A2]ULP72209.1 hypothetical protein BDGGKGIB_01847 [Nodularia sphaerocarpa UHCC 0038]